MKDSQFNVIAGLVAIALVIYFGIPKKVKGDDAGTDPDAAFVPGGGDMTTGYGVTGSWLAYKQPLL